MPVCPIGCFAPLAALSGITAGKVKTYLMCWTVYGAYPPADLPRPPRRPRAQECGPREWHRRRTASPRVASRQDRRAKNGGAGPGVPASACTNCTVTARYKRRHHLRFCSATRFPRRQSYQQLRCCSPTPWRPAPGIRRKRSRCPPPRFPSEPAALRGTFSVVFTLRMLPIKARSAPLRPRASGHPARPWAGFLFARCGVLTSVRIQRRADRRQRLQPGQLGRLPGHRGSSPPGAAKGSGPQGHPKSSADLRSL
jgi:hypothetical protein